MKTSTHSLARTNEKGVAFIGRCTQCGLENLPMSAVNEPCDNPNKTTQTDSLISAIKNVSN